MRRKTFLLLAWAVIGGLTAACAGGLPGASTPRGGTAASSPAADAPADPIDACAVLTDAEIEAATGQRVSQRTNSTLTQVFPSLCDIELDGGGALTLSVLSPGGRSMYETSFEPLIGEGEFAALERVVSGVGDKAAGSGDGQLMVLKGDVLFDVHYIEYLRADRDAVARYVAEIVLAKLGCIAAGCPGMTLPPPPVAVPSTPGPTDASLDPGSLPSTGALARVVNLYSEGGQPVDIDVYAYAWSEAGHGEIGALVATVPYGQASGWFNPGLVQSPFSTEPATRIHFFRRGERATPLTGVGEFLGPGTVTTIAVWQEEVFEGQPSAWAQTIYAEHPSHPIPEVPEGQALLSGIDGGLRADEQRPIVFASIGDGCLESLVGRHDPAIPNAQPLGNDLVLPPGEHMLTIHDAPVGEVPTCTTKALGPAAPVSAEPGGRLLVFPYRLPTETEISLLVVPAAP